MKIQEMYIGDRIYQRKNPAASTNRTNFPNAPSSICMRSEGGVLMNGAVGKGHAGMQDRGKLSPPLQDSRAQYVIVMEWTGGDLISTPPHRP
jgi:hypothetical protein